jgi:hypothetical protein
MTPLMKLRLETPPAMPCSSMEGSPEVAAY